MSSIFCFMQVPISDRSFPFIVQVLGSSDRGDQGEIRQRDKSRGGTRPQKGHAVLLGDHVELPAHLRAGPPGIDESRRRDDVFSGFQGHDDLVSVLVPIPHLHHG